MTTRMANRFSYSDGPRIGSNGSRRVIPQPCLVERGEIRLGNQRKKLETDLEGSS